MPVLDWIGKDKVVNYHNEVNHINFCVEDGVIVSILGSSGSGKTTLLNIILGIIQPDCGEIFF